MKHKMPTKLLSLLLATALLVSCCPFAFAAEDDGIDEQVIIAETEAAEAIGETEAAEAAEAAGETEAAEATEPAETAEVTEATEAAEATEPTEAETESVEETEPTVELPAGLKGLPEGYILSAEELAVKQTMADNDVAQNTAKMTAGVDYEEGVLLIGADSQEAAELYAEAFCAELLTFDHGLAKIRLNTATVVEAVEAAQDSSLPLPAAYPNQLVKVDPIVSARGSVLGAMDANAPQRKDWNYWVENMVHPDPALLYPGADGYVDENWDWQWQPYQYMHDTVDTYAAWGVTTGEGVTVAVLDSGVDASHPDLRGHVVGAISELGDGTTADDEYGHGTHVSGIIAATMDNGIGGAGIAPGAGILNVRVLDEDGWGDDYGIIQGIYYAADFGADVINMSLGSWGYDPYMQEAINYAVSKNATVVAAMGNEGINRKNYPAAYDNVIAVVATDPNNTRAAYSTYGTWADVAAPGSQIYSTVPGNDYESWNGTSMATPVVSGVIALYKSINPDAKPAQIEARLKATATKGGKDLGAGIVNAAKMLSAKPAAPAFTFTDAAGAQIIPTDNRGTLTVPCESKLAFNPVADDSEYILYTLDGSTPAVKNGIVVKGIEYDWNGIDLAAYAGKTITVKAVQINGLGMMGTVLTKKVTVQNTADVTGVKVTGPSVLIAGKSSQFTAVVEPADKANQGVTWEIVYRGPNMATAKIDTKGNLTVPKLTAGQKSQVHIQASSKTNPDVKSGVIKVTVEPLVPAAKIVMNPAKLTLMIQQNTCLSATAYDSKNQPLDMTEFSWISSNPKAAVVDSSGSVTAVAKGTAVITCKALDGSGRTAKCTVTVTQPVESIQITGQASIASGASAAFKAGVLPASANNKTVEWSLRDAPQGVTVSAKGVVKVPAGVNEGSILLEARAKDGSGVTGEKLINIAPKCTSVFVWFQCWPGRAPGPNAWDSETQKLTSVGLFNVDLKDSPSTEIENEIELVASPYKNGGPVGNDSCIAWSSSNPAIASVDENGKVTAHKAGTAKITAAAMDGSGKKAVITVKVTVPVSTMSLVSSAPKGSAGMGLLAAGKSVSHKVVFGKTFGTPSNQKVYWNFDVGYSVQTGEKEYEWIDVTEEFLKAKAVSFSGGKLTIKPAAAALIKKYQEKELFAEVYAQATDGTGLAAWQMYRLVEKPATKLYAINKNTGKPCSSFNFVYSDNSEDEPVGCVVFVCDQFTQSELLQYEDGSEDVGYYSDFVVDNSNPKAVNVLGVDSYGDGMHAVWFTLDAVGASKITVKTTDGSNKSCTFTVKVVK